MNNRTKTAIKALDKVRKRLTEDEYFTILECITASDNGCVPYVPYYPQLFPYVQTEPMPGVTYTSSQVSTTNDDDAKDEG